MRRPVDALRYVRRLGVAAWRVRWLRLVFGIAAAVGSLWLVVVVAPPWFVDDDSLEGLKAQNEVRTTLLQGLAGVVLLVGAYFTWRQLHTVREGQITERFTRAVDQFGSDKLDVRLGGILSLERIARDSQRDRATIAEILSAFVREHASWPPRSEPISTDTEVGVWQPQTATDGPPVSPPGVQRVIPQPLTVRMPDVHAAVNVLSRMELEGVPRFDLSGVDLRRVTVDGSLQGANLIRANLHFAILVEGDLRDAWLNCADLREAVLDGADLRGAALSEADLRGALLRDADLRETVLSEVRLQEADLSGANLEGAHLRGAHLEGANLSRAKLEGANFGGANLEGVVLAGANLVGARADHEAIWPAGFDWRAAGVTIAIEDAPAKRAKRRR
jgi:hypothetical protein